VQKEQYGLLVVSSQGDSQAVRSAHVESENFNVSSATCGGPHAVSTEFQFSREGNTTKSVSCTTCTLFGPALEELEFYVSPISSKPETVLTRYPKFRNASRGRIAFSSLSRLEQSASNCSFCQFLQSLFDPADIHLLRHRADFRYMGQRWAILIERPFDKAYGVAPPWDPGNLRYLRIELSDDEILNSDSFIFSSQSGMPVFALFIYTTDVSICRSSR
jgi:hypothetical protein